MSRPPCGVALIGAFAGAFWLAPRPADAMTIPAFARQYRTGCSTCHVAAPKLNVLGEAFRLNGYRMPENAALLRKEAPVPLGEEPWEDLWPRAIWPGEAPGTAPFAIRLQSGMVAQRAPRSGPGFTLRMPEDVYIMAGSSLGEGIGALVVAEWDREDGFSVRQAKVLFQDVLPFAASRALNVSVGLQGLYLLTTGDRQIDRAGIRAFQWQGFSWSAVELRMDGVTVPASPATFSLAAPQPAIVLNGIVGGRTFYSVGLAQGTTGTTVDGNSRKDVFYTVRRKWGGLRLDGAYDAGEGPPGQSFGQLRDNAIILEHFGYAGGEPTADGRTSAVRAAGAAVRLLHRGADVGLGAVRRWDGDPWNAGVKGTMTSTFARAEYLFYPWLIGSLKYERFGARASRVDSADAAPVGFSLATPGVVMLVRQNIRLVVESDLFLRNDASAAAGGRRPHRLATRLDLAF